MKDYDEKLKLVIVDTGVDLSSLQQNGVDTKNIHGIINEKFHDPFVDQIGHGTAISFIVNKILMDIEIDIYVLNIFENEYRIDEDKLIEALSYIYRNEFNIVHISSGIQNPIYRESLHDICKKLKKKGVIIVSSFDNFGVVSYPACFNEVISVSISENCKTVNEYIYVENSDINILGFAGMQRLPWKNNSYMDVCASSFASPYITAEIIKILYSNKSIDSIHNHLKKNAKEVIIETSTFENIDDSKLFKIGTADMFPASKEILNVYKNRDLITFKINDIYDYDVFRNPNNNADLMSVDIKIKSWKHIFNNKEVDTLILGHTRILNKIMDLDLIKFFINECILKKKNLYCFDSLKGYEEEVQKLMSSGLKIFSATDNLVIRKKKKMINSLHKLSTPVLAICGTSSNQGKLTLQLNIKRIMEKQGYDLGLIGTEPNSLLFGMDEMISIGYGSLDEVNESWIIPYMNYIFHKVDLSYKDLIVFATQSQTVPYTFGNMHFYNFAVNNILTASEPDAVILCVNPDDEIEYIFRTINYLENYFKLDVICLAVYPYFKDKAWLLKHKNRKTNKNDVITQIKKFERIFKIPTFLNNETQEIVKVIENYF